MTVISQIPLYIIGFLRYIVKGYTNLHVQKSHLTPHNATFEGPYVSVCKRAHSLDYTHTENITGNAPSEPTRRLSL